ncbi:MAG: metallophosphoesterase family protein [Thermodesulfobacteriota bacterium]
MKILIISDIHANWHALQAVLARESHDALIFLGDVVDFGPDPKNCVNFLMKSSKTRFWGVRGDHDHALAFGTGSNCSEELSRLSNISREWGECFLSGEEVGFLRRLPLDRDFSIDGIDFEIAHGSDPYSYVFYNMVVRGDQPSIETPDESGSGESRKFILTGHSHKPFVKTIGNTTVLNPGSVGQPRDRDPRASYGVIENGEASIRRISYDIEKTVKDLERSGMPCGAKSRLISMLVSASVIN